jgi:hypothetical protein
MLGIRIYLILLFIYAAISKLVVGDIFKNQLYESPLMPETLIPVMVYAIPLVQIFIAIGLTTDNFLQRSLYASFALLLTFTIYLSSLVLFFSNNLPCSCGGILGTLGYAEHIIFNVFSTLVALAGCLLPTKTYKKPPQEH